MRPSNEASNGTPGYMQQTAYHPYPNNNIPQAKPMYPPQSYYSKYISPNNFEITIKISLDFPMQQNYTQQTSASQISNQSQISQVPSQYSVANNQQQTQSSQTSQQSSVIISCFYFQNIMSFSRSINNMQHPHKVYNQ